MPLEDYGNRIPQITAEITSQARSSVRHGRLSRSGHTVARHRRFRQQPLLQNTTSMRTGQAWFIHYDLRTMSELFRVQVQPGNQGIMFADPHLNAPYTDGPYGFNPCFSIGGNYFWDNNSPPQLGHRRNLGRAQRAMARPHRPHEQWLPGFRPDRPYPALLPGRCPDRHVAGDLHVVPDRRYDDQRD
jgi:hypothetical protein